MPAPTILSVVKDAVADQIATSLPDEEFIVSVVIDCVLPAINSTIVHHAIVSVVIVFEPYIYVLAAVPIVTASNVNPAATPV